jgi:hypothetical protein
MSASLEIVSSFLITDYPVSWRYIGRNIESVKNIIFWDITTCSPLKFKRRFGRTHRLHLQGRSMSRGRCQRELSSTLPFPSYFLSNQKFRLAGCSILPPAYTLVSFSVYMSTLHMKTIRVLRNVGWPSTDYTTLYVYQKIVFYINPTHMNS